MNRGFTLLELMVAIAVFAVLGLMSSQLLTSMIRQHDIIGDRGEQLIGLQFAMTIMERDVSQIWNRPVRDEYGDPRAPFDTTTERPIEFTRIGWRNPLEHERSELQRVAYEHREKTLYRYYWSVLDRSIDTEPVEQVMLEGVLSVEFEALNGNGDSWQQPPLGAPTSGDPLAELTALRVRFDLEGYGEITRLWEVPANLFAPPGGPSAVTPGDDATDADESEPVAPDTAPVAPGPGGAGEIDAQPAPANGN